MTSVYGNIHDKADCLLIKRPQNPQESNNVSAATSTTESISPPPSLSQSTRSTTAVSSRSSCPSNPDAAAESTPLLTAVMRGNVEIARLLINNGGNVDCKKAGKTALHMAVEGGDTVASRTLLDLGADITLADDEGMTVVHKAVGRDDSEQLRALLKWAEERSKTPSSEGLLQKCLNAKDKLNRSLVHMAVLLERMTILRMLLEYGADVNE
ncbi:Apicidin F cluster transcription factor apf2 [Colletotrichum spinosum]|uniref:Apicidin F cluster transcription factor apf2 n=1 Tax=Colletotrichum spinosum TaxID=1347390 RepID=A0A4R8QK05_9PEZI|nr:Apicidin F cluster transcription factor apf2 [Colletotrichum spinosum]